MLATPVMNLPSGKHYQLVLLKSPMFWCICLLLSFFLLLLLCCYCYYYWAALPACSVQMQPVDTDVAYSMVRVTLCTIQLNKVLITIMLCFVIELLQFITLLVEHQEWHLPVKGSHCSSPDKFSLRNQTCYCKFQFMFFLLTGHIYQRVLYVECIQIPQKENYWQYLVQVSCRPDMPCMLPSQQCQSSEQNSKH